MATDMNSAAPRHLLRGLRRFDPRSHLAAAIGWTVLATLALASIVAATTAARETESRARADVRELLSEYANHLRQTVVLDLQTRQSMLNAAATQILASSDQSNVALRRHLEAVQAQFPEFAWLGAVDAKGRVIAATNGTLQGTDVSGLRWYRQGRGGPVMSDAHLQLAPTEPGAGTPAASASMVIDLAEPLAAAKERGAGVLGAQLSWRWVETQQERLAQALDPHRRLDVLVLDRDRRVLSGPTPWIGKVAPTEDEFSAAGRYLIGQPASAAPTSKDPGWTVWVRQDAASALSLARVTRNTIILAILLSALVCALAALAITRKLTHRLERLAHQAQAIRLGEQETLTAPEGADEVARIGAALAELVGYLQREKQALQQLNAELDARVVERTARIERLAEGARHSAVTRERLRMARALHDTLAHSLVALLTQIRMVRKLGSRMAPGELETELATAEEVATSGLASAREAITEMRYGGVRDSGLGAAIQALVQRFGERTGVSIAFSAEQPAADLADERAELVFRIVEEALHNVERHARAHSVTLSLKTVPRTNEAEGEPLRVRLVIEDDGVGFEADRTRPGHYGLRGMREQAALIGARLSVISAPGRGTRLVLDFDE
jgi:signal transduction histidine kinase